MNRLRNLVVVALFAGGLAVLTAAGCGSDSNQPTSTGGTGGGVSGGGGKAGGGGRATAGASGSGGAAGTHGSAGAGGAAGAHGTGGAAGAAGTHGTGGTTGAAGSAGSHGAGGSTGGSAAGSTGTTGAAGAAGTTGAAGTSGVVENSAACLTCEQAGTVATTCGGTSPVGQGTSLSNFGCDGLSTTADKTNCLALLGCLRGAACQTAIHNATADYGEAATYPQPYDDPHPCLCGNISLTSCLAMSSGWTGVCAAQFVVAATADGQTVSSAYTMTGSPVGLAVNLSICDIDNSCQSSCVIPQ